MLFRFHTVTDGVLLIGLGVSDPALNLNLKLYLAYARVHQAVFHLVMSHIIIKVTTELIN